MIFVCANYTFTVIETKGGLQMKKKVKDFKNWVVKNKGTLIGIGIGVAVGTSVLVSVKWIGKAIEEQEKALLKVVENNLKLKKDGEFFEVIVSRYSDDYTKTIASRRWTKLNGEPLYLGRVTQTIDLSEDERIGKQIEKIGLGIANAVDKITKK
jgi:hypothetical protein